MTWNICQAEGRTDKDFQFMLIPFSHCFICGGVKIRLILSDFFWHCFTLLSHQVSFSHASYDPLVSRDTTQTINVDVCIKTDLNEPVLLLHSES